MNTESALNVLEHKFDLTANERQQVVYSCSGVDLLDEHKMKQLLKVYTEMVKGTDSSVGEAYMTSWFRGPMLGLLYMLSAWNKTVDLSLNNVTIEICEAFYNENKYYRCGFRFTHFELIDGPEDADQNEMWAKQQLSHFFEKTVLPVFETISKVGTLQIGMLWGQLPTSLEYGFEALINSDESDEVKRLAERNYKLIKSIDGERFGRNKNPFDVKVRWTESMDHPDKQIRMKNACCLYYLVEEADYCFSCPRLKESEREIRREACRAKY